MHIFAHSTPWLSLRKYATGSRARLGGATLSLEHVRPTPTATAQRSIDLVRQFLQRVRVLSLYRTILRATRRIPDLKTRAETRRFARDEIERHRDVTDIVRQPQPHTLTTDPKLIPSIQRATFGTLFRRVRQSGKIWRGILMDSFHCIQLL
ncbi:hypothetical protein OQA88_1353 [Cercophora sp. LCS_1]